MPRTAYAIKISTGTSLSATDIGLFNGEIKLITGRDRTIPGWKNGLIAKDGLGSTSQEIDISWIGSYSTMSGFNFTIPNHNGFSQTIKDLEIDLLQSDVTFYSVFDGIFKEESTFKVNSWDESDTEFRVTCRDNFRSIHKPLLKKVFTTDEFGDDLPSDLKGKPVPVSFGYASKSKLYPIIQQELFESICTTAGISYDIAPCTNYTSQGTGPDNFRIVHLKTMDKTFTLDELVGKYITAVKGGSETRRIRGNAASSGGTTQVYLDSAFSTALTSTNFWSSTSDSVWYFQISSLDIQFIASQSPISEFLENDLDQPALYVYDDTDKEFISISDLVNQSDTSDLTLGYPGISVLQKPTNLEGDTYYYLYTAPTSIVQLPERSDYMGPTSGGPTSGTELTRLYDNSDATRYTWVATPDPGLHTGNLILPFKIKIPEHFLTANFENIYLAINYRQSFNLSPIYSNVRVNVRLVDYLGRTTAALDTANRPLFSTNVVAANYPIDMIFTKYFNPNGDTFNLSFENGKAAMKLNESDHITKSVDASIYPYVIYELAFGWDIDPSVPDDFPEQMLVTIHEMLLVGEKSLNLLTSDIYTDLKGDTFGSTWGGRRTSGSPVLRIGDLVEKVIRDYDGRGDVIDSASFDALSNSATGYRKDWVIGSQVSDEIDSYDLLDNLAGYGLFGIVPKTDGKRAARCWMESVSAVARHDASVIEFDSIGTKELTPIANLYNEFEIRSAWNPATEKYDRIYKITEITATSFPTSSDSTWKTYAVGFSNAQYSTAKTIWERSNLSYRKYGVVRKLPQQNSDCPWFPDPDVWGLSATQDTALLYLDKASQWTPFRKEIIPYSIPNVSANSNIGLLDEIEFNDAVASNGEDKRGWIVSKSVVPGTLADEGKDSIEIRLMLEPEL
jgi:hypothetical protein